jgi:hypothetical protein
MKKTTKKKKVAKKKPTKAKSLESRGVVLLDFYTKGPGRPKITLEHLPKKWDELILSNMEQGASLDEIHTLMGISHETHRRLMQDHPEYFATIKRGVQLSKTWWLRVGRTQLFNKEFSYTGWYMNMKNRFGWTDKQEHDVTISVPARIIIPQGKKVLELKPPDEDEMVEDEFS